MGEERKKSVYLRKNNQRTVQFCSFIFRMCCTIASVGYRFGGDRWNSVDRPSTPTNMEVPYDHS